MRRYWPKLAVMKYSNKSAWCWIRSRSQLRWLKWKPNKNKNKNKNKKPIDTIKLKKTAKNLVTLLLNYCTSSGRLPICFGMLTTSVEVLDISSRLVQSRWEGWEHSSVEIVLSSKEVLSFLFFFLSVIYSVNWLSWTIMGRQEKHKNTKNMKNGGKDPIQYKKLKIKREMRSCQ